MVHLLQQAIDFMEAHLQERITWQDAAENVRMSAFGFHRTFSFLTGMTPGEYLRARRLSQAAQALQEGASVLQAADLCGYESSESFAKAFYRFHGCTPGQARSGGRQLCLTSPLTVSITVKGGKKMDYRMEHVEPRCFLALTRSFSNEKLLDADGRSIPDFWRACAEKDLLAPMQRLRPSGRRDLYGLCDPTHKQDDSFLYGIGVLWDGQTDPAAAGFLQDGYCRIEAGAADYVVLRCMGADADCLGEAWERFYREFCPQTGYIQADTADYEVYYEAGEPGLFCELWIPVTKPDRI